MRIATLPGKLLPGMHLFPPLPANHLGSAPGGLDLGLPQIGDVAYDGLTALAVRTTRVEGAELPVVLLFIGGQRRPFAVNAIKIRAADFGIEGSAHRPEELRSLVFRLAEKAPHLVVDNITWDFLDGRMLTSIGEKLGDLADAIGLILVNKEPLKEVALPGSEAQPPPPAEAEAIPPPAPEIWTSPAGNVLIAFAQRSVFLAGMKPEDIKPAVQRLRAGQNPREVLGDRVGEIPFSSFVRIRRDQSSKAIEIELRAKDGTRKTLIPYAEEYAGEELFEAFKKHLRSGRPPR